MNLAFFVAKKFSLSKRQNNFVSFVALISTLSVALGVFVLIIALSILDGFEDAVKDKIISFDSHILISTFGNVDVENKEENENIIKSTVSDNLIAFSPYISKKAIAKGKDLTDGFILSGHKNFDEMNIKKFIVRGSSTFENKQNLIIGKSLADKLGLKINDKITIFTLNNNQLPSVLNPPNVNQFIISGIFESGMAAYDDLNAFIDYTVAEEIFNMNGKISGYTIKLKSLDSLSSVTARLEDKLPHPYFVRDLYKLYQHIFTWLDLQKEPIPIILGLITIVAVFNIISTLLMVILERMLHIGILRTLGTSKQGIIAVFLYQGIIYSTVGIIMGVLTAFIFSYLQLEFHLVSIPASIYFISYVPVTIKLQNYLIVSAVTLFFSILTSLIPSYIASKQKIIDSLRFK